MICLTEICLSDINSLKDEYMLILQSDLSYLQRNIYIYKAENIHRYAVRGEKREK